MVIGARTAAWSGEIPYITDGLMAIWDGRMNVGICRHSDTTTVWKDLSGNGYDMQFSADSAQWDADGIVLGQNYFSTTGIPNANTVECVYEMNTNVTRAEMVYFYNSNIQFAVYNDKFIVSLIVSKNMPTKMNGKCSLSVSKDIGNWSTYVNGVLNISGTLDFYSRTLDGDYIGNGTYAGNKFRQKIMCVRLYDRALTASEIAVNYAVDARRYGIGGGGGVKAKMPKTLLQTILAAFCAILANTSCMGGGGMRNLAMRAAMLGKVGGGGLYG